MVDCSMEIFNHKASGSLSAAPVLFEDCLLLCVLRLASLMRYLKLES